MMAAKSTKQSKKDQKAEACGDDGKDINMAAITSLLEEHRAALSTEFKTTVSTLDVKLDRIQAIVTEHASKISSLEAHANSQEERSRALETTCAMLTESNAKLFSKVVDLESRSRRNNIRIIGLPESIEGPRPSIFFSDLLVEVLGNEVLESPPECDRAHRSLTDKPKPGQRPRPVIIRLHKFQQKDKIIRQARARRGKLQYRGTPIAIYEDYAPEVVEQRSKYKEVLSELYKLGLKPSLSFPARLTIVTKEGNRRRFATVAEAKEYAASLRSAEN